MIKSIRPRFSFANVIAMLALFLALGGTALAIDKSSVKSKHIVDNTIKSKDIKDGKVSTNDIKDGSLTGDDIADSSLTESELTLKCDPGRMMIRGWCFDQTLRPAETSVYQASEVCKADGGWLPTPLQLRSANGDVTLAGAGQEAYTDSRYDNGGPKVIGVRSNGATVEIAASDDRPFVCIYSPYVG